MKRFAALFLSFLLLLTGCGSPVKETTPASTTAEPTISATVPTTVSTEPTPTEPAPTETTPAVLSPEPSDSDFVRIADYLPDIRFSLPYATSENFTGQVIYDFTDPWLRYGTVKKLMAVYEELSKQGLSLLIWDGFRPVSAQFTLWEVCPDPTYVANPETGYSSHSRGNTLDLTLTDQSGTPLEMPTGFDDFSKLADRDYSDCTETAAANARLLQNVMETHGFSGYFGEWWHFSDTESYPVEETFTPVSPVWLYADCNEFITLRTQPDTSADAITRIPKNGEFQMLARSGDFAYVDYEGLQGYVLLSYTQPVE
ncbi:MAG: SH3 domain-containing protein [Oscillospiraceae bacterium]|nr:SH3 domain-containing protein [Oscillospiraceae bacterium]